MHRADILSPGIMVPDFFASLFINLVLISTVTNWITEVQPKKHLWAHAVARCDSSQRQNPAAIMPANVPPSPSTSVPEMPSLRQPKLRNSGAGTVQTTWHNIQYNARAQLAPKQKVAALPPAQHNRHQGRQLAHQGASPLGRAGSRINEGRATRASARLYQGMRRVFPTAAGLGLGSEKKKEENVSLDMPVV
jgi:hypothetical protein